MPVTIKTAPHPPKKWDPRGRGHGSTPVTTSEALFEQSYPAEHRRSEHIMQSSFKSEDLSCLSAPIHASSNGFVRAAISAYNNHHHLTIRPEDVWFSILTQLGFSINAHAEDLRSFFVAHEGRKLLIVEAMAKVDFGDMAVRMTQLIQDNVVDPELRDWIMPDFSTTTEEDGVVAAVLMMGALQQYFEYMFHLVCGIPSVTLLGERDDWEKILKRLDILPRLGSEPTIFASLLKPVLEYFVQSFDDPSDPAVLSFWGRITHRRSGGSDSGSICGWLTAFCFWKVDGKCLYQLPRGPPDEGMRGIGTAGCDLDGTLYHAVKMDSIPDGCASVPVRVDDNGYVYKARMAAGSVGIRVTSSGDTLDSRVVTNYTLGPNRERIPQYSEPQTEPESGLDSLQPVTGWWMYKVVKEDEIEDNEDDPLRRFMSNRREPIVKIAGKRKVTKSDSLSDEQTGLKKIGPSSLGELLCKY